MAEPAGVTYEPSDPQVLAERADEIGWRIEEREVRVMDGDDDLGTEMGFRLYNGDRELLVEASDLADVITELELEAESDA